MLYEKFSLKKHGYLREVLELPKDTYIQVLWEHLLSILPGNQVNLGKRVLKFECSPNVIVRGRWKTKVNQFRVKVEKETSTKPDNFFIYSLWNTIISYRYYLLPTMAPSYSSYYEPSCPSTLFSLCLLQLFFPTILI